MYHQIVTEGGSATSTATLALPDAIRGALVGEHVLLAVGSGATSTNDAAFAGTDERGNTYSEVTAGATAAHAYRSGTSQISLLLAPVTTALQATDTIDLTHGGQGAQLWAAQAHAFAGLGAVDQVATAIPNQSTNLTVSAGAAAAQNAQLVVAAFIFSGDTAPTIPAGWSGYTVKTGTTAWRSVTMIWRYVDEPGTRSASITIGTGSVYAAVLASFNVATVPQVAVPDADISGTATVVPGGTASAALADPDPATRVDFTATGQTRRVSLAGMAKPVDTASMHVSLEGYFTSAASASVVLKLYEGATLRGTSAAIPVTAGLSRVSWVVPAAVVNAVTTGGWGNLELEITGTVA